MPEQGDILLVPIPFTDLSSQKRRPVIVVSNNVYNQKTTDLVVAACADVVYPITSLLVKTAIDVIKIRLRLRNDGIMTSQSSGS